MPRRNSTVEIVDGKVVFSKEVLEYFESIRNEENSVWIDEYFERLSDKENLTAEKYNRHHIIPCFSFKDENHKTRKETLPLANKVENNIIKLSVYNHIIAHYCLWKIFNNEDSRRAVYLMYEKRNLDYLSENEMKEFAKIQEECAKENRTKEEFKEYQKRWYEEHKEEKAKERAEHKEERSEYDKEYYRKNKEKKAKYDVEYRKTHKEKIKENSKRRHELKRDELLQKSRKYYQENRERILKENAENAEERRENNKKYRNQTCIDPTNGTKCTLGALSMRKRRNGEKYKDIIPQNCIIDKKSINA